MKFLSMLTFLFSTLLCSLVPIPGQSEAEAAAVVLKKQAIPLEHLSMIIDR